ncbi:MAG: hypothetical protein QGF59_21180, partial [Pirellulaceae bacterium]|nr:hypothetical protein [Pirellulaceae bacterium]
MNDAEQPKTDETKADAIDRTLRSGPAHEHEPPQVLGEEAFAQTTPAMSTPPADPKTDAETLADDERERIHYF